MLDAKVMLWWRIYLEPKMWYKQVVETITGFISVWVASTARCGYTSGYGVGLPKSLQLRHSYDADLTVKHVCSSSSLPH